MPDTALSQVKIHDSPATDPAALRRCLGNYGTGVAIMTTCHDGVRAGITANSFAPVSLDPPLVLWSVTRTSTSAPVFLQAGHFAVNILAEDQIDLCKAFAKSGPDKFADVACGPGLGDAPVLMGALATLECRVVNKVDGGDHVVMIGEVERMRSAPGTPLLFVQGRFATAADPLPARQEA